MKTLPVLLSALLMAPGVQAYAEDRGESSRATTDANGTTVTTETSHTDDTGLTGTRKTTSEVKTVVDPKGMMNKNMAKSEVVREVKPNGDFSEEKVVSHANGTLEKVTAYKSTAKHWTDKGKTVTTTESRIIDPKGLGNKQVYEAEKKVVEHGDGMTEKTVTEKVNGEVVSKEIVQPR